MVADRQGDEPETRVRSAAAVIEADRDKPAEIALFDDCRGRMRVKSQVMRPELEKKNERMTEPCDLSAVEARRLIVRRSLSPMELLQSCISRIEKTNGVVNAIVAIDVDTARKRAAAIEQALVRGEEIGMLSGLPIGVKDLQATAGLRTTSGSLLFKNHVPDQDEQSVANVRNAGGVILAKTNTPEFGAGGNTTNRVYGPTSNPFDLAKTCGGSSGGSAVALALGQVPLATGTDYGGSVRTPAAFCGVVGFRPSPGVVASGDRCEKRQPVPGYRPDGPHGGRCASSAARSARRR